MQDRPKIGTRIRDRRLRARIRQSDLAGRAGISPSYLNLIEHDRRRIGGKTLLKLAEALGVEPLLLTEGAAAGLVAALHEAAASADSTADPTAEPGAEAEAAPGDPAPPERDRVEDFAERFPGWAALLALLHRRNQAMERSIETLTDRLSHDPFLATSLHEVISAVTAIRATSSILMETEALEPEWQARFYRNINEDSARLTEGAQTLVRYLEGAPDRDAEIRAPQDEMHAVLARNGYHFAELERGIAGPRDVARLVRGAAARGLSAPAQSLLETVLMRYLGDARALPMRGFLARLSALGPAPDRLAEATGAGLAQVFRRLAAMPAEAAGPIGLAISDASGTLVFRKPIDGFAMPRLAGACARWPLYRAMAQPMMPVRMRVRQTGRGDDGVLAVAVAGPEGAHRFDRPAPLRAHMLLLPDPGAAAAGAVHEMGVSCRICPVGGCAERREPSILSNGF